MPKQRLSVRAALACVAVLASMGLMAASASAETISFTTKGCTVWTAPGGVAVQVQAVGAAGNGGSPGRGDGVSAQIGLSGGEQVDVCVDQGGSLCCAGKAVGIDEGGGWSGVILGKQALQSQAEVVAAGGGGGHSGGGDAGKPGEGEGGGGAGTLSSPGAAGEPSAIPATAGSPLQGGNGGEGSESDGGGGGGGYYGGGGGGAGFAIGGGWNGGGGSDFCGNGAIACEIQAVVGTMHGAGAGSNEAHVTLTTSPLAAPTVTKVSPNSGPASGDKVSTITGTNLKFVHAVNFGGVAATKYTVNEAGTEIGVVAPAQEVAGVVDVTVTTVAGTSKATTKDHYKSLPVITKVEPNTGSTAGGLEIFVFGAGFKAGFNALFSFGTTTTTESLCNTTECAVITPPHAAGTVDVRITVNGLISAKTKADQFTYK